MPKALPREVRDLVQAYVLQGLRPKQVSQKTGVNALTIGTLTRRHGWKIIRDKVESNLTAKANAVIDDVANASVKTRSLLSKTAQDASESLAKVGTAKGGLKRLKAVSDVLSTLTVTADKLYGWSTDAEDTIVSVSVLRELAEPGALDIKPCQTLSDNPAVIPDTIYVDPTPSPADTPAATDPAIDQPVFGE